MHNQCQCGRCRQRRRIEEQQRQLNKEHKPDKIHLQAEECKKEHNQNEECGRGRAQTRGCIKEFKPKENRGQVQECGRNENQGQVQECGRNENRGRVQECGQNDESGRSEIHSLEEATNQIRENLKYVEKALCELKKS